MWSNKQRRRIIPLLIILAGIILGGLFLSPILNNSLEASGLLGGFIGFLISLATFPEIVKGLFEEQSVLRQQRISEETKLGFWRSFTHPTQLPTTIGILWFIGVALTMWIFEPFFDNVQDKSLLALALLIPTTFLFGLSGFMMVLRKEGIDKYGRKYFGTRVYINGISTMIFGWGGGIILILVTIFT